MHKLLGPFKNAFYYLFLCVYVWNAILYEFRYKEVSFYIVF